MNIICPQCHLQGEIANVPADFTARVDCARCATALVVSVVNGEESITLARPAAGPPSAEPPTAPGVQSAPARRPASLRERLALSGAPIETPATATLSARSAHVPATAAAFSPNADELRLPLPSLRAEAVTHLDAYGAGARALRVSPLWLLTGGVAVVVFVVFCNWLFRSGTLPRNDAAVNLSPARATARDAASLNGNVNQRSTQLNSPPIIAPDDAAPADEAFSGVTLTSQLLTPNNAHDAPASASGAAAAATLTVQVGAFNKPEEAEALIEQLAAAGIPARLEAHAPPKHKIWYRVQAGSFATHNEAAAYGKQLLAQKAVSTFVVAAVEAP